MRSSINEQEWTTNRIRGQIAEVCVSSRTGEIVILGTPEHDDESHNCDALGCGQWHVLWRRKP